MSLRRVRLKPFGYALVAMALAAVILALIGETTVAWIVAVVGLLLVGATFMPKTARGDALDRGLGSRNLHR